MDENAFWESYYPKRLVLESITTDETESTDAIVQIVNQAVNNSSALVVMIRDNPTRVRTLTQLRQVIKPFLDAISPKEFDLTGNILKPVI